MGGTGKWGACAPLFSHRVRHTLKATPKCVFLAVKMARVRRITAHVSKSVIRTQSFPRTNPEANHKSAGSSFIRLGHTNIFTNYCSDKL